MSHRISTGICNKNICFNLLTFINAIYTIFHLIALYDVGDFTKSFKNFEKNTISCSVSLDRRGRVNETLIDQDHQNLIKTFDKDNPLWIEEVE